MKHKHTKDIKVMPNLSTVVKYVQQFAEVKKLTVEEVDPMGGNPDQVISLDCITRETGEAHQFVIGFTYKAERIIIPAADYNRIKKVMPPLDEAEELSPEDLAEYLERAKITIE
jgi:hypothetical protein